MADHDAIVLSDDDRRELLRAIQAAMAQADAFPFIPGQDPQRQRDAMRRIDVHLDEILAICRTTRSDCVEAFCAQFLEDVCPHCSQQQIGGWCSRRLLSECPLFSHVRPVTETVSAFLQSRGDPVYLAHHPAEPAKAEAALEAPPAVQRYQRLLIAVDDTPASRFTVQVGAAMAGDGAAAVELLHVVRPPVLLGEQTLAQSAALDARLTIAQAMLQELATLMTVDVTCRVLQGRPAEEIIHEAESMSADLILVGDYRRRASSRFPLGSTADAVMRHAPCSVLVVRE